MAQTRHSWCKTRRSVIASDRRECPKRSGVGRPQGVPKAQRSGATAGSAQSAAEWGDRRERSNLQLPITGDCFAMLAMTLRDSVSQQSQDFGKALTWGPGHLTGTSSNHILCEHKQCQMTLSTQYLSRQGRILAFSGGTIQ